MKLFLKQPQHHGFYQTEHNSQERLFLLLRAEMTRSVTFQKRRDEMSRGQRRSDSHCVVW